MVAQQWLSNRTVYLDLQLAAWTLPTNLQTAISTGNTHRCPVSQPFCAHHSEDILILDQQFHSPPAKLLDDSIVSKEGGVLGGEQLEVVEETCSVP